MRKQRSNGDGGMNGNASGPKVIQSENAIRRLFA